MFAHQPLDTPAPDALPGTGQGGMHARTAVGLAARPMRGLNLFQQPLILERPRARWAATPRIEAAGTDPVEPAHQPDRVALPAVLDEREDVAFRLEVNSMAFFKSSCSSFEPLVVASSSPAAP